MNIKGILMALALALIIGAIFFIEQSKVSPSGASGAAPQSSGSGVGGQAPSQEQGVGTGDAKGSGDDSGAQGESSRAGIGSGDDAPESAEEPAPDRPSKKGLNYEQYHELEGIAGYINANDSFQLSDHVGKKVILIDFWTYSCINCQRTLPYLTAWDRQYRDQGLLIVGVHTPEFGFEKVKENVERAVDKYSIEYPVVQDNDYQTWRAYRNRYWPRKYLIDIDGYIVYNHIGEGGYEETQEKIRELLAERMDALDEKTQLAGKINVSAPEQNEAGTPELYLGYEFSRGQMGNNQGWKPGKTVDYALPAARVPNLFYLSGAWHNLPDAMQSKENASLHLTYRAKNVFMVAEADEEKAVSVFVDGAFERNVTVQTSDLYTLVSRDAAEQRDLRLEVPSDVRIYTFTFG